MTELLAAFIAGGSMAALVTGIFSLILYKTKKKDEQQAKTEDENDVTKKALRYLMLYIIQNRAEGYIQRGNITVDERRSLRKWHDLYHDGLGGNGDADLLMDAIDELETNYN